MSHDPKKPKSKWEDVQETAAEEELAGEAAEAELVDEQADIDISTDDYSDAEDMPPHEMQQKLGELQEELAKHKDMVLRAKAEVDNMHRISKKEVADAHKFGLKKFTIELLPILDTLERAIEVEVPEGDAAMQTMYQGVEMTLQMFRDACNKHGLETMDPVGEKFDPAYHEAISMQEDPNAEPNTVLMVVQKGYILNERVIRPAKVIISRNS